MAAVQNCQRQYVLGATAAALLLLALIITGGDFDCSVINTAGASMKEKLFCNWVNKLNFQRYKPTDQLLSSHSPFEVAVAMTASQ